MQKILIVEDETQLIEIYKKELSKAGFEVISSVSVDMAFKTLELNTPDLIILDIMLPGGRNGFDFLEAVKKDERYEDIPVLVMSNLDTEEKTAREIGASDYIVKANVPVSEIVKKVKEYISTPS